MKVSVNFSQKYCQNMGPFILFQLIRLLDLANTSSVFYQNLLEELSLCLIYIFEISEITMRIKSECVITDDFD